MIQGEDGIVMAPVGTSCTTLYAQDTQNAYKAHSEDIYYCNMPDSRTTVATTNASSWL